MILCRRRDKPRSSSSTSLAISARDISSMRFSAVSPDPSSFSDIFTKAAVPRAAAGAAARSGALPRNGGMFHCHLRCLCHCLFDCQLEWVLRSLVRHMRKTVLGLGLAVLEVVAGCRTDARNRRHKSWPRAKGGMVLISKNSLVSEFPTYLKSFKRGSWRRRLGDSSTGSWRNFYVLTQRYCDSQ